MRGLLARLLGGGRNAGSNGGGRKIRTDGNVTNAGTRGDPAAPSAPETHLAELLAMPMPEWTGAGSYSVGRCVLAVVQLEPNERFSRAALARCGLKVWTSRDGQTHLAIANKSHAGIRSLLAGSVLGASDWWRVLRRIEGARPLRRREGPTSIDGIQTRVTLVPIATAVSVALDIDPPPRPQGYRKIDLQKPFHAFSKRGTRVTRSVEG